MRLLLLDIGLQQNVLDFIKSVYLKNSDQPECMFINHLGVFLYDYKILRKIIIKSDFYLNL